jgi:hypothetical protein
MLIDNKLLFKEEFNMTEPSGLEILLCFILCYLFTRMLCWNGLEL